jgi:hypothetical protein
MTPFDGKIRGVARMSVCTTVINTMFLTCCIRNTKKIHKFHFKTTKNKNCIVYFNFLFKKKQKIKTIPIILNLRLLTPIKLPYSPALN